jgi:pSer/pThr/pTyr-binding forkhead associated (FHA) protein
MGIKKGKSVDVQGDIIYIGRLPDSDIQIMDKTVSRKHLRITRSGDNLS